MKKIISSILLFFCIALNFAQNPLVIPPALTGTTFNLNVQNGTTEFFPGINTPTYGVNGSLLGPTLIINKWDWVTLNVTNSLTGTGNSTTMHWHGLHVPAADDGGPHQIIEQGDTWSPQFQMLNDAGTYWYHPHGAGKTDLQVSKGIAGFIIVKDSAEALLTLPRTYGVDDFPVLIQTKAFDMLYQIAIATEDDTLICINGTVDPYLNAPAQVIRLRLLNGSSMRFYNIGFSDNITFYMIGSDGGLLPEPVPLTRLNMGPGERAEILLDLTSMEGQSIQLMSYSSELPNGYYGASTVIGMMGGEIPGYDLNPLNGANFPLLDIDIVSPSPDPVVSIPSTLIPALPVPPTTGIRNFSFEPDLMMDPVQQVVGPFNINGFHFDMEMINETVYINTAEKWRLSNNTGIVHPFHIHNVQFRIDNINGGPVPLQLQGNKDVVAIKPQEYVDVIMQFKDFSNDTIPYMYHCHMLHHEDDGMMGSFRVIDTSTTNIYENNPIHFSIFPNPAANMIFIQSDHEIAFVEINVINSMGESVIEYRRCNDKNIALDVTELPKGIYLLQIKSDNKILTKSFIKS